MVSAEELFDRMPCGLLVTSPSGLILKVNRTLCQWTGIPPHELVRQTKLQELFTVGGRIFHQPHWQPMLEMQGAISEVKLDIRRGDGTTFPALLNVVRRTSGEDTFDKIAVMVAEERNKYERELLAARKRADDMVAKERQAQQALQASRSRLRQAMQSGAIHVWDLDPATGRRRFGADVAILLGLDPDRPVGEDDFVAHVVPEDRAVFAEQMIGIVSHDLRNPLTTILLATDLLTRQAASPTPTPPDTAARMLGNITRAGQRARRLIADLLDFTVVRLGAGLSVSRRPVDLHQLAARIIEELSVAFPGRTIEHTIVGGGEISADPDRIAQLLGNLVGNAMAYGTPGSTVTVSTAVESGTARLAVHNHGDPIPRHTLGRLFQPMVRGVAADDTSARSVGLGLFIVRAIAQAHGGQVVVQSSHDHGTEFAFSFPARATEGGAVRE
ncbi:PAS domain-containing sensor histidine kinase [Paracidovorax citrulli]|uniref:histidine kinase n=3 Tax=Paracidovorax citrulli TaxID=80869 RepID=A1TS08_PARC0|nr:PAS domain-containing sensor histidine kinase [Paracidovorax citrulli]ABM33746.1 PAS/PAC sensor signal transduction histidine kinase [Paracidovorax citrulli AAC00-1]ATG94338.1 PAS domain-containing sensor histidine kinase [Paracidovorax citrulli]MVT28341.1 PAS domain-containing protein [Paracidovorax citrulli]PVY63180.1 sigma-B regulation protein RsbU (phosphoserine phosphatase) [Paracidovorax citrulli]REG67837.1 sigma-B regulation protein RsbU (phosphoserine phosphatase) [Paracidovorax cit